MHDHHRDHGEQKRQRDQRRAKANKGGQPAGTVPPGMGRTINARPSHTKEEPSVTTIDGNCPR